VIDAPGGREDPLLPQYVLGRSGKDIILRNYKYEIFTYPDVEAEPEKQDTIETKFKRKRKATYKKTYEKSRRQGS